MKSYNQKLLLLIPPFVHTLNTSRFSTAELETIRPDLLIVEASSYNHDLMIRIASPELLLRILIWGEKDDEMNKIINLVEKGLNYLSYPVEKDLLAKHLTIISQKRLMVTDNDVSETGIIGISKEMKQLRRTVTLYGKTGEIITITGETGTGKDLTARALHKISGRTGPFIAVNCAAIPDSLLESEMFGSVKGAFTDSVNKTGYFEAAQGGTFFLDEIGEMPLSIQSKMLRILEEKQLTRLGSTKVYNLDVRIICATSRNLKQMMEEGSFRKDLFYRLHILTIEIPPLRYRKNDIPQLCMHIMEKNKSTKKIHPEAMMKLLNHSWTGNVRELKSTLRKAEIISLDEEEIKINHIEFI